MNSEQEVKVSDPGFRLDKSFLAGAGTTKAK